MDDVQTVAWRNRIGDRWHYSNGPLDPREIHDNGKLCEPLVLRSDLESLAERVRELEGDAARYRWLRRQNWSVSDTFVVSGGKERVHLGAYCPSGYLLDSHINTAMQQDGGGREG